MISFRFSMLIALLSLATIRVSAQTPSPEPPAGTAPPAPAAPAPTEPTEPAGPSRLQYGVRFGPSFTTLTNVATFDDTAAPAAFEPTMNFGVFVNLGFGSAMSLQPEVLFAAKGHRIRDKGVQPITTATGEVKLPAATRVILVRYLEIPLLLRLAKRTHENTSLYFIAGPAYALQRSAVIRQVADSGRHDDIDDLVNGSDLSYIAGVGLQHRRWLLDARLTRGMRNIATDPLLGGVKTSAFSVLMGARF
jgi:Outer membrane protein beta-barrel domain